VIQWWCATGLKAKDCDFSRTTLYTTCLHSTAAWKVFCVFHATQFPWVRLFYITWNHYSFALRSNSDEWNIISIFVEFIPLWYIILKLTYVNHNKVALVLSIYATSFGHVDRPQALKYITLKQKIKFVYYIFIQSFSSLSYDRPTTSSKASSPHSAI